MNEYFKEKYAYFPQKYMVYLKEFGNSQMLIRCFYLAKQKRSHPVHHQNMKEIGHLVNVAHRPLMKFNEPSHFPVQTRVSCVFLLRPGSITYG